MIFLEQGSVLPSTKDDQSNDSVTIVDQITIKEGSLIKKHKSIRDNDSLVSYISYPIL